MRSIKLRDILGATVSDKIVLSNLAATVPLPQGMLGDIQTSYVEYRTKKGSSAIVALGLPPPWPDEFSRLYDARTKKDGLDWIDKIAHTTQYGYCPMCGAETHKTVDHFLPRKPWAEFSFLSLNLVPSCGTCNTKRGNRAGAPTAPARLLHPYYDHKLLNQRLHITRISPPFDAPKFDVGVCDSVSSKSKPRVEHHLESSVDATEYQQFCRNRWAEARQQVTRCHSLAKWKSKLIDHRDDAVVTSGPNSWRTAFYAGLVACDDAVTWLFKNRATP